MHIVGLILHKCTRAMKCGMGLLAPDFGAAAGWARDLRCGTQRLEGRRGSSRTSQKE